MECPKCEKSMTVKGEDTSHNFKVMPKKQYKREVFQCETDDIWITVETPIETKTYPK